MSDDPYREMRWSPEPGQALVFDEQYRSAQLPLVAPGHPRVLERVPGRDYRFGRYERARVSLVADLGASFLELEVSRLLLERLAASSFADKIAFDLIETRAANLHCTIVGDVQPTVAQREDVSRVLHTSAALEPVAHGPFVGHFNRGRIYIPVEFVRSRDCAVVDAVSACFGKGRPTFAAVGLVNLRDELLPDEARDLADLIEDMAEMREPLPLTRMSWTSTTDDLTLDMRRLETIRLGEGETD